MTFATLDPAEAANLIQNDMTVGFSGFTPAGSPKIIPGAIAAKALEAGIKEVVFCCLQPSDLAFYQDITNGRGRNPEDVFAEAEAEVRSAFEAAPSGGGRASGLRSGR